MIDKNGKLLGKINIIDLLIILVIIAAAVFIATKAFTPAQEATKTETSTVRVQFFCYKAQVGAADAIEIGAPAFEDTTNVDLMKRWHRSGPGKRAKKRQSSGSCRPLWICLRSFGENPCIFRSPD